MEKLELKNRKNTTAKALEALETLVGSFEFSNDLDAIISDGVIPCVGDIGGDRSYIWSDAAKWRIDEGSLVLYCWINKPGYVGYEYAKQVSIDSIKKINFAVALEKLQSVIEKYNQAVIEKDAQIEKFLAFCGKM